MDRQISLPSSLTLYVLSSFPSPLSLCMRLAPRHGSFFPNLEQQIDWIFIEIKPLGLGGVLQGQFS